MFVRREAFHLFKCKERVAVSKHTMIVCINMLWCIDCVNRDVVRLRTSRQPPISRRNPSVKSMTFVSRRIRASTTDGYHISGNMP
eukprot:1185203-Prorocentrum_minimum.AAC.1